MTPDQMNVEALLQSRDYFNTGTQSEYGSTGGQRTTTLRRQGTFNLEDTRDSVDESDRKMFPSGTQDSLDLQRSADYRSSEFQGDDTNESPTGYRLRNQYMSEGTVEMLSVLLNITVKSVSSYYLTIQRKLATRN